MRSPAGRRPLYIQVRDKLIERIRSGEWKPGEAIPNEFQIGDEYGVSQGTARKAIGALGSLVVRRQGAGTFVVDITPAHVMFRFFNFFDERGNRLLPDSENSRSTTGLANPAERAELGLDKGSRVIRVFRNRTRGGKGFITETITLPQALFPDFEGLPTVPNTLYDLYQKSYGIFVVRTEERVTPVLADAEAARALDVPEGTPLLRIARLSFHLDGTPIEWRISLCHLDRAHYLAHLS
jgi:GntR family transcriptional regulator